MHSKVAISLGWRHGILLMFILGSFIWVLTLAPIPQDQSYHAFADAHGLFIIPNFLNVISNVFFLVVGLLGIQFCTHNDLGGTKNAWLIFFVGIALVAAGSAYYHLNPNNTTLVLDRLPMTVGFMGLFIALLSEYVDSRLSNDFLLFLSLLIGAASVLYWHWTDDLRFYAWVQFMPLIVVLLLFSLFKSSYPSQWIILVALACYVLAKITEAYDTEIFRVTNDLISGHTLKHCLAAAGCYFILLMLKQRKLKSKTL